LIACSIIAVIIGVSSVFPLAFIMSATADTTDKPWFSVDVTFAYWVTSDGPFPQLDPNYYVNTTNYVRCQHKIGFNTTLNVDTTNEASDGRVEYYKIEISSDQRLIQTLSYFVGTNSNSSFGIKKIVDGMHFSNEDWFDTDEFVSGGGTIASNWTTGSSEHSFQGGTGEAPLDENSIALMVTQLREAQTITITVYRIGWATFTGDSITFTSANNTIVDQIQLEKYGEESWLYNDLYPEDELVEKGLIQPLSDE
jgi:hypothetical protein